MVEHMQRFGKQASFSEDDVEARYLLNDYESDDGIATPKASSATIDQRGLSSSSMDLMNK